ncbi:MAG: S-adenosylmethionine:tRNA ribosyltransferase-isomerase [Cytophagales bacterium]|jgi:S-adenosylmethionine:tRNA ribosyltransferase-isomerase|nr:S-adenosylmethionine:tRNA ribosyltransferase-isomerase [Cytophagales bacterium]
MEGIVTEFPAELIAQYLSENRSGAKLMVVHRDTEIIEHRKFSDLFDYFNSGDVLAFNRSKIFNNILIGVKDNFKINIEVTLLRELSENEHMWEILVSPARKIRIGNKIFFGDSGVVAEILDNTASRCRTIKFLNTFEDKKFKEFISKIGIIKLPKYIRREIEESDYKNMTSIYADSIGSLFPSVSGLHFDEAMWQQIEERNLQKAFVTLHIGMSSINKINTKVLKRYKVGSEYCKIAKEDAAILTAAKKNGNKICSVGVSTLKSLESSLNQFENNFQPLDQWVTKLIYDPYKVQSCDMLLTNFSESKTCQHICSAAFCGSKLLKKAYSEAVKNNYKFLMYGDSLLIV